MTKLRQLTAALIALTSIPVSAAKAQGPGWLEDRARAQGPGIRLGNFELHPGVGAEVGYDSNVFYGQPGSLRPEEGSALFRISPHLFLSTLGQARRQEGEASGDGATPRMVEFDAGVASQVYFFLIDRARHNVAVDGHLNLNINPTGRFGLRLSNVLSRQVRPFTNQLDELQRNFGRIDNTASAIVYGRSRGGLIQSSLGYSFGLSFFEASGFSYANRLLHTITADTHYKFLPNTSLFWDASAEYADFTNLGGGAPLTLANNWRLRTRVGINGAVTPKVSATLAIGYSAAFVQSDLFSDFDSVIALAGMKFRLTPTTTLGLGYERDSLGSVLGLYRFQDRGYLDFQWLLGRSFLLGANFWVAHVRFGDVFDGAGVFLGDRTDVLVNARLFGEYRFTDWLALNLTVGYLGDFTDFEYPVDSGVGTALEPAGFNKVEAWLGVRVFY